MENTLDKNLKFLLESIIDLPNKFDEETINSIEYFLNSDLSYSHKNEIAQSIINISKRIYQTKRFISKPLREIFYSEFQKVKSIDVSENDTLRIYFQSIVVILLNLIPKEKDPGLGKLIKETNHINNKILIVKSVWKSFNEYARDSLSSALDFGVNIYNFTE